MTKNFSLAEFTCKDGTPVPPEYIPNVEELAKNLQVLRDYLDEPIHINSGYRTKSWNHKQGGRIFSQHLVGKAADITVKSKTPKELKAIIEQLIKEGQMSQGGIGLYPGFVHYDIRGEKARW